MEGDDESGKVSLGNVGIVCCVLTLGCDASVDPAATPVKVAALTSVAQTSAAQTVVAQTPLAGTTIPRFVDPLPTFNGRRVDGTATVNVNMQEFQQKVLPASIYAGLAAPYNAGTYLWGYNINNAGASWPARTIESKQRIATTAIYTNSLVNTHLQNLLTVDQTIHWADPLGTTAATTASMDHRWRPPAPSPTPVRSRRSSTCTATRSSRSTTDTPTPGGPRASPKKGGRS